MGFSYCKGIDLGALAAKGIEKKPFGHDFVYRFPESRQMPRLRAAGQLKEELEKKETGELAFYFHLPFCSKACRFCHYYKETGSSVKEIEQYLAAVKKELGAYMELLQGKVRVQSVFFGGGTPTMLRAEHLIGLLQFFRKLFPFKKGTEVSIESSPETLQEGKLSELHSAGFNRLSIGVQDFDENVLRSSNRIHSPKQAEEAVEKARSAGFENINMDFIYGLPGQSIESWQRTMKKTVGLDLDSVTASDLRVQESTEFFSWKKELFPSVEQMLEMYYCFVETFMQQGMVQQFPYQFVKKGKEMRFLEQQWSSKEFIGIGASSCSFAASWDYNNALPMQSYLYMVKKSRISAALGKRLSSEERMKRFVALGLKRSGLNRKDTGVGEKEFRKRFGIGLQKKFGEQINGLGELGLIEKKNGSIKLSCTGLFFHDEVARKFF